MADDFGGSSAIEKQKMGPEQDAAAQEEEEENDRTQLLCYRLGLLLNIECYSTLSPPLPPTPTHSPHPPPLSHVTM